MVKALTVFSTLAAFVSAATAFDVPPDQAWQIVDTHTAQPDCLTATNRKCDVIDIAQVTQECGRFVTREFTKHVNSNGYTAAQWKADTDMIAANWKRTADILNASLPLDANHDFYQRMAAADMIHWTQHLPLFTVFHSMVNNSKILLDSATIHNGVQTIYTQSDVLAETAFDYLPTDPPTIREQIGNLRQWLTDEFEDMLAAFPA